MDFIDPNSITRKAEIDIRFIFNNVKNIFDLQLLSDESGFDRTVVEQNLHRPGLALAGFVDLFSYKRVQIMGNTEMQYLAQLDELRRSEAFERIMQFEVPCIIITNNNQPFPELISLCNKYHVPLFLSKISTTKAIYLLSDFLDDQFAPRVSIHGSFVDVYGVGVLFVGKSGIGKSEVALDLVERGHRLVADDAIILTKKGEGILMGTGADVSKHFLEIRGLGLINIAKTFGIRAVRYQKRLEILVALENWSPDEEYERLGLENQYKNIMEIDIPFVKLPIVPGKNITVIAEVIALNYLLKTYGYNPAVHFQERVTKRMEARGENERDVNYFFHDFE